MGRGILISSTSLLPFIVNAVTCLQQLSAAPCPLALQDPIITTETREAISMMIPAMILPGLHRKATKDLFEDAGAFPTNLFLTVLV